jgi:hypothetical protein
MCCVPSGRLHSNCGYNKINTSEEIHNNTLHLVRIVTCQSQLVQVCLVPLLQLSELKKVRMTNEPSILSCKNSRSYIITMNSHEKDISKYVDFPIFAFKCHLNLFAKII